MSRIAFVNYTYRTYSILHYIRVQSSVSPGFAKQIMPILLIYYNGSLVTGTVVSSTAAKFKPLIFSVSGFALAYTVNMFILMILYDFCLLLAQFCANRGPICTSENFLWCRETCFAGAAILRGTCLPLILRRGEHRLLPI
jgi:hypothetical protein